MKVPELRARAAAQVVAADRALVRELLRLTGARSEWVRRFALATASALNQKGRVHVAETLAICGPLVADRSPRVRKAVGWALREASRHDPAGVEAFLRRHAARGYCRRGQAMSFLVSFETEMSRSNFRFGGPSPFRGLVQWLRK